MNTSTVRRFCVVALMASVLSCTDQGDVVNYLEIMDVSPPQNATQVDKASSIYVHFDREVSDKEAGKIQVRYVDSPEPVTVFPGCGFTPEVKPYVCLSPFIWKPGRTVEVTIPNDIADQDGNTLRQPIVYRFTVARDTVPFDLVGTQPAQDDTVSLIGSYHYASLNMTFNDYVYIRDSTLAIDPPAILGRCALVIPEGRVGLMRQACFTMSNLQPQTRYTITIPRSITDYEGETLPRDYHVVFHTRP